MGLRFGGIGLGRGALFAREPAIASVNPHYRTQTRYVECGRGCPGSHERVHVRMRGFDEAPVVYRRVAPSCSCRSHGPNTDPRSREATVASGKIG